MDQFFWFYVSQKQRIKMISQANLSLWKMGKWKQQNKKNKHLKRWKWLIFFLFILKLVAVYYLKNW